MSPFASQTSRVLRQIMHSRTLKKVKPLRALLRFGASGITNLLTLLKDLRFPSEWGWAPKFKFLFGLYEPGTTLLCRRLIEPGMIAIDIGANVGYYSLLFSKLVGPSGKVYAFEPHPEIFQLLRHNVKKFKNVIALQKAVSNTKGECEFFLSKMTGSHSFYVPSEFLVGSCKVETVRLDDFLHNEGLRNCNFIKIDVEGAEPLVIEGMRDLISRTQRLLVILEFNPSALRLGGRDPENFLRTLQEKFDFVYYVEENNGSVYPVAGTNLSKTIPEYHAVNLLCSKGEVNL